MSVTSSIKPSQIVSLDFIRFQNCASYCIVSYRIVSYRIVSYRIVSYRVVSYRIVSYRIVSYRIVSYRIVSYRIVSYRIYYTLCYAIHVMLLNDHTNCNVYQIDVNSLYQVYYYQHKASILYTVAL